MKFALTRRSTLVISLAALLALLAIVMAESNAASVEAYGGYQSAHTQLLQELKKAQVAGYTGTDLEPITSKLAAIENAPEPIWVGDRASFYHSGTLALQGLRTLLGDREQLVFSQSRATTADDIAQAKSAIEKDRQLGVDEDVATGYQKRLDQLNTALAGASKIVDVRAIDTSALKLADEATKTAAAQESENAAIQKAADALLAQNGGNLDAIRKSATAALMGGRNDATVAAYEAKPGRFKPIDQVMRAYNRMEKFSGQLGASDTNQVAFAAAAIQRYSGQVHDLLMQNLGPKHIIVNWTAQEMWAYEGSNVVLDSLVTTGIRGDSAYGTDFGPMKVLWTSHPWKMHSPWPQGSQYWYPDTTVQWTVFFTNTGESFHDASWEADSQLGPGSQFDLSTRSHGCVHLPYSRAQWLFGWADLGTPVDVFPGDGQPVSAQLAEITTDDQGNPNSASAH
ncbi:MAG TPA: L,D-transpeptidase [Candidatus Dormibacteraeota bacterium]